MWVRNPFLAQSTGLGLSPGLVNADFDRAGLVCILDHFGFPGCALETAPKAKRQLST
jgi:hypothetical protein